MPMIVPVFSVSVEAVLLDVIAPTLVSQPGDINPRGSLHILVVVPRGGSQNSGQGKTDIRLGGILIRKYNPYSD